MSFKLT